MRFYDVDSGASYVDGTEVRDITRSSLRRAYTMVLQDTWLFKETIFENIAYGGENASVEEVEKAARAARIDDFIESLPDFCFNISHSKDFIAIAIDRKAVGIDVETLRDYKPLVAKRFFHENEYCFLEYLSHEKQDVFFTQIWTLKESYVKFTGLGIANNFSNFSIILDSDEVKIEGKKHLSVYFKHYVLSDSVFVSVCATSSSFPSEVIELSFPSLIIDGDF
jgi:phosphopantetheine--protein transferase-like protein